MKLSEAAKGRDNNLNFIRLLAAIMVVYNHCFTLSTGSLGWDKILVWTREKEQAGGLAVNIFFVISGFLIARSYVRTNNTVKYFKARFLRMWPALAVSVLFMAFVAGPRLTYAKPLGQYYFKDPQFFRFLRCMFFNCNDTHLPGLWTDHFDTGANGSLWTITYEVVCYILVVVFAKIWVKYKWTTIVGSIALGTIHYVWPLLDNPSVGHLSGYFIMMFGKLGSVFLVGMAYYCYQDKIKISWKWALVSVAGIVFGIFFLPWVLTFNLFGAYLVMYLSFQKKFVARWYDEVGDLSYGVYIWSFPLQQEIVAIYGGLMFPYHNFWLTIAFVLPVAWISYRYIEEPALKLKDKKIFGIF